MTLIDVLDENGNLTGEKKTKQEIHLGGYWHRAAHVWIYNSKGEILLQLRAKDKDDHPGCLDISAAGHVDAGETADASAVREIEEEIGLKVKLDDLKFIGERVVSKFNPQNKWQNNEIDSVYLYKFNGSIDDLSMPDGEVEGFVWISTDNLLLETSDPELVKKYVNHEEYFTFVVDAVKKEIYGKR